MTEFSVIIPLQGKLARWCFFEGLHNYMGNKNAENEKKYLETLIVPWIKWTGMVEIKHKDFIDVGQLCLLKTHCG